MDAFIQTLLPQGIIVASRGDQLIRVDLPSTIRNVHTLVNDLYAHGAVGIDYEFLQTGKPQLVIWTGYKSSSFFWTPFLVIALIALYWSTIANTIEGFLP